MNKQPIYVCVNCPRVPEGTLRNALPRSVKVISATNDEFKRLRFYSASAAVPVKVPAGEGTVAPTPDDGFGDAKSKVALMLLEREEPKPRPGESKSTGKSPEITEAPPPVEPDCILYHILNDERTDAEMVSLIRRKCSFRDVTVIVVSTFRDLPRAQKLLGLGADDILVLPMETDEIRKRLTKVIKPAGSQMPVVTGIINPYINAAVELLSTMAGLRAEKKTVFLKKNYRLFGDISAIMPFTGHVEGEVVVCFEESLARTIVSRIMSARSENLTKDELREGVGELVNIIAGNAKATLATTDYRHQITLPTVVFGQNHEISHPKNAPCIVVVFEVETQPMAVLVSMAAKGNIG
jgi:chemotaxis protein CheX